MNDWIDVGVFPSDMSDTTSDTPPEPLYLHKHRLESGEQTITITVDEEPGRTGIDPYAKLIDRDMDDNVMRVSRGRRMSNLTPKLLWTRPFPFS